ncbi:radical SAM protein [Bauldia litoralis]|uniref:radical SAM protein n=1 Tax=Bauldia litoralis TaxID=665467 RepID=UPI000B877C07|nr:radical SAM protein [Bauldia litoralis]
MKITERFADETGAAKVVLKTEDDHRVEASVFIAGSVEKICVSCQVGCSYTCRHCATWTMGLGRNLSAQEMYDQVVACKTSPTVDVLFMGMGEPFANLQRVLESVDMLVSSEIVENARQTHIATSGIAGSGWKTLQGLRKRP